MIAAVAAALTVTLGYTVYHGSLPDAEDTSMDEALAIIDFPLGRQTHEFGTPGATITNYGIEVLTRSATSQTVARARCQAAYDALLSMGYTAVCPPVSLGQDSGGRFQIVAQVQAHEISV